MVASLELKRALTRQFRELPGDPVTTYRELRSSKAYVPLMENRALLERDPVDTLFDVIHLQPETSTVQLLSGFRGSGKTTALLRLHDRLTDEGYAAIRVDIKDYLSIGIPLEVEPFLLFLSVAAAAEAQARDLVPAALRAGLIRRTREWFARLRIDDVTLEVGGDHAKVSATLSLQDRDRLTSLRNTIGGRAREFASDIAADLRELHEAVAAGGRGPLVLIVDSVEQYRGTYGQDGTAGSMHNAMEELFSVNADLLDPRVPGLHLIYTVPPYLRLLVGGLANRFQPGGLSLVPAVKVIGRDGRACGSGVDALRELVTLRLGVALKVVDDGPDEVRKVMERDAIERLVTGTGGLVRDLVRAVARVIVAMEHLPASVSDAEIALRNLQREYEINDEDVGILVRVRPQWAAPIEDNRQGLALWARQLDAGNVLCYDNGEEWFVVNPLVAERVTKRAAELASGAAGPAAGADGGGG